MNGSFQGAKIILTRNLSFKEINHSCYICAKLKLPYAVVALPSVYFVETKTFKKFNYSYV